MLINLSPLDFKIEYEDAMGSKGPWIEKVKGPGCEDLGCQDKVMKDVLRA